MTAGSTLRIISLAMLATLMLSWSGAQPACPNSASAGVTHHHQHRSSHSSQNPATHQCALMISCASPAMVSTTQTLTTADHAVAAPVLLRLRYISPVLNHEAPPPKLAS